MVLVGPSGCGKSTTLRMIAGLEEITSGTIRIDGRVVNQVPPKDRDIAMVFQNYALYPHLSVYENMAFGLKLRKFPRAEIESRVREAAGLLGLTEYLERKPKALSGGQRQRVAVGRAIVRKPKVFLFDEPLSNLDAKMRVAMRMELAKLRVRLEATMIYVTHDQVEAMTMGDRICVMKDGQILQVDRPLRLYHEPRSMFVAGFIGSPPMNFFRGTMIAEGTERIFVEDGPATGTERLVLKLVAEGSGQNAPGSRVPPGPTVLGLRPEHIHLLAPGQEAPGMSRGSAVTEIFEPMGAEAFLHATTGRTAFVVRAPAGAECAPGQRVELAFDLAAAQFFDPATGLSLA
jgi:multiple sugar transport system ATP-binding protein